MLRLEEKGLLITIVDKEFDISSLHDLKDELGDTYNNIVHCICASGSLVRYRPTTVAFELTRAFFLLFYITILIMYIWEICDSNINIYPNNNPCEPL